MKWILSIAFMLSAHIASAQFDINTAWHALKQQMSSRSDVADVFLKKASDINLDKDLLNKISTASKEIRNLAIDSALNPTVENVQRLSSLQRAFSTSMGRALASIEAAPQEQKQWLPDFMAHMENVERRVLNSIADYNLYCNDFGKKELLFTTP